MSEYLRDSQMLRALVSIDPQQLILASHKFKYCYNLDISGLLVPFRNRKTSIQLVSLRRLGMQGMGNKPENSWNRNE
jgi:hypothetical protein